MEISKLKLTWKYLTGGVDCVIEYLLDKFSEQVLSKADPDALKKYCADFKALSDFISILITNHRDDWGERKTSIVTSIVIGIGDLSSALSDGKITKDELDRIIDEIEAMIKLFNA